MALTGALHGLVLRADPATAYEVASDCPDFLALLRRAFGPRAVEAEPREPDAVVRRHTRSERAEQLARDAEIGTGWSPVTVQHDPAHRYFERTGVRRRLKDGTAAAYVRESRSVVVCDEAGAKRRLEVHSPCTVRDDVVDAYRHDDAFRAVRHAFFLLLIERGRSWLHAGAVVRDGRGVLLIGDARAGKTTSLVHLLVHERCAFLTNGRSLVSTANGGIEVAGYPEIVLLRQGHFETLPSLRSRLADWRPPDGSGGWSAPETTKIPLFGDEFADRLGAEVVRDAAVTEVVYPALGLGPRTAPPAFTPAERGRILRDALWTRRVYAEYGWFRPEPDGHPPADAALVARLLETPSACTWLDARGELRREQIA